MEILGGGADRGQFVLRILVIANRRQGSYIWRRTDYRARKVAVVHMGYRQPKIPYTIQVDGV